MCSYVLGMLFICVGEREAAYSIVHQSHMLGRARLGQGALPRVVGGPSAARDERRFAGNYPGTSRRNMNARESPTDLAFADEKPKQTRFIFRCPFVLRHSPNANICPSFVTIFSLRGERSSLFDSAPKPYARACAAGAGGATPGSWWAKCCEGRAALCRQLSGDVKTQHERTQGSHQRISPSPTKSPNAIHL